MSKQQIYTVPRIRRGIFYFIIIIYNYTIIYTPINEMHKISIHQCKINLKIRLEKNNNESNKKIYVFIYRYIKFLNLYHLNFKSYRC